MFSQNLWIDLIDSDNFYRSPNVHDPQYRSDAVSTTEIKSSCVRIGWKLIYVGPETILIETCQKKLFVRFGLQTTVPEQQFQTVRLISITHFLEFGGVRELCVREKIISHTMSIKTNRLQNIWNRFDSIFIHGSFTWQHMNMFTRGLLTWFDRFRRASSVSDCPWPSMTVIHNVCDGDRTLACRNRLKMNPCGFRSGFDWNLWKNP